MAKKTMSIAQLLDARHGLTDGDSVRWGGRHNAWRLVREGYYPSYLDPYTLWHNGELMLKWDDQVPYPTEIPSLFVGIGHGSQSDQLGMNIVFRHLGLPLRYERRGGVARIIDTTDGHELPVVARVGICWWLR